ncbi:MAG: 3-oxoacyl-[acyl-carrier-protein] reductase FabG [Myxococcota bacterium]|nr:3-oxoacyl-[acyl-carrier-protein] reductase FabG [Myxococcota bacterium]
MSANMLKYGEPEGLLEGKTVLVTGAARGIGAAIAETLAREGARMMLIDLPNSMDELAAVAQRCDGRHVLAGADLASPDAAKDIASRVRAEFGGLDVAVHNAGITRDKMLVNMDDARWNLVMNVNLAAVMRLHDALEPVMNDGGSVINLSSVAGIAGNAGQTNYAASKSGVIGLTRALAKRLARRRIRVNAIAPGFIETRLTDAIPFATREAARRLSALSQGGLPQDIANLVVFLASPHSGAVTGQIIRADGGMFVGA